MNFLKLELAKLNPFLDKLKIKYPVLKEVFNSNIAEKDFTNEEKCKLSEILNELQEFCLEKANYFLASNV